ncbi:hypothetical protein KI688_009182 [Linnemannia hyalina]|uniref:Uncharacterized protein n=1 Tax=Linnemannia hyalina TaxID=64524 RepID=A0A9P7XZ96_9FUNG|nr:hypothetical protein KI688_009182 [Linnemannia hyalina]
MSTDDINSALSKVTPQKVAFLVEAWLVHQAIPDISTIKFIAAIIDLDFEIVRYWFYCRSNRDGIKRAFARSAAGGSDAGIVLPLLEEYHLLDRFSDDIGWDYQGFDRESQEQGQEPPSSTSATAPQQTRRQKSSPSQQQQQKRSSVAAPPSDLIKTRNFDHLKQPTSGAETQRRKTTRKQHRRMEDSGEDEDDGEEQESDSDEFDTLGTRSRGNVRASGGSLVTSRLLKVFVQGPNDKAIKKRGRPLGSFNKKRKLQPTSTMNQPLLAPTALTELQQLSTAPVPTFDRSQPTDPPQTNIDGRYLTPIILLPAPRSLTVPSTESTTNSPSVPIPGLVGDPMAGAESRKKFLEQQQSVEAQQRRERNRARSAAPSRTRSSKGSNVASSRAKSGPNNRKIVHLSEDDDGDQDDDEEEDAKDKDDCGSKAHDLPSSLRNAGDARRVETTKGPALGNPPPFFKEYGGLVAKRREKQPVQEQPSESTTNILEIVLPAAPGAALQQVRSPAAIPMAPIEQTAQHPLPANPTTPTLPSQAHFGEPNLQHHPHNHSPPYLGQTPGATCDGRGSFTAYAGISADYGDQQALELERVASRQRDMDRRKEEAGRHRGYDNGQLSKEHRSIDGYSTDRGRSEDEKNRGWSRDRWRRSDSQGSSHRRDQPAPESRGRSLRPRPLILRRQVYHATTIESKSSPPRDDGLQSTNNHADEILSPQLHKQHRYSRDGSHSPYSPKAIDPALFTTAHSPYSPKAIDPALFTTTSLPPQMSLPHVATSPRQPQYAQPGGHYPLGDRRRSSRNVDPGAHWDTHHEHQRASQGVNPVPTAPASFFSSGDRNGNSSSNNEDFTDVHKQPHQLSLTEFYSPRPINLEPHTSHLPPQPPPFSPPRLLDRPPIFSAIVIPLPNFSSREKHQNDVSQRDDSWTARPKDLSRTLSRRSVRRSRGDDDGGENKSGHPLAPSKRSKSRHSNSRRRSTEEYQGSNGDLGHRDRGHRDGEFGRQPHHRHHDNHSHHRGDHDGRRSNGQRQQLHQRTGGHDRYRGFEFEEYEVDKFHRLKDNNRRTRDKSLRARSSRRPSSPGASQQSYDQGQEQSRRRPDVSRDQRGRRRSSARGSSVRDNMHSEPEVEHTMSEWEKRRELERGE